MLDVLKKQQELKVKKEENKEANLYELTVQLGCLRAENSQLKKDLDDFHEESDERIKEAKARANGEYDQLQEEYANLKVESEQAHAKKQAVIKELKKELGQTLSQSEDFNNQL